MLKACERLRFLTPELFATLGREEQVAFIMFAKERDLEELERAGSLALGKLLTTSEPRSKRG